MPDPTIPTTSDDLMTAARKSYLMRYDMKLQQSGLLKTRADLAKLGSC